jgi:hypothetical protein
VSTAAATENLTYDVFVNEWPQQTNGLLPNGEPKRFSPQASTLIYGSENAVLTDPGMTADQARALGDWVAEKGRNVTDIIIALLARRARRQRQSLVVRSSSYQWPRDENLSDRRLAWPFKLILPRPGAAP